MLEFLRGQVVSVTEDAAILEIGGVGLRVQMATGDLAKVSGETTVHTVLQVRDEDVNVFGFTTERGRELFRALTKVTGVGPKLALAVLSFHPPEALERAIVTGDADALGLVPGVGKKTAGRIALELRDKLGVGEEAVPETPGSSALAEVREALKGLGYSAQEVQPIMVQLPSDGDVPTLLRHALRSLGGADVDVQPSGGNGAKVRKK